MRRRRLFVPTVFALPITLLHACSSSDPAAPQVIVVQADAESPDVYTPIVDAGADVVTDGACPPLTNDTPRTLECTGLYANLATKQIADDIREYRPAYPLWSDGADKVRWISLPAGATIEATDPREWTFPVGTKVWKEFRVAGRRVETRFFQKLGDKLWVHSSYQWTDDELGANRVDGADLTINDSAYHIPTPSECDKCHSGRRDRLLGFEAVSLGLPGATGLTLDLLTKEGRLQPAPAVTSYAIGDDGSGKSAAALGWLHANCGVSCHNENTTATAYPTGLRLRLDPAKLDGAVPDSTWDPIVTAVDVGAVTPRWSGRMRIAPGRPAQSLLVALVSTRGTDQMPPLDTYVVDDHDVEIVREWIANMPNDGGVDASPDGGGNDNGGGGPGGNGDGG